MSDWKPKRFWKNASAGPCEGGYTVTLDDRPVKTPAKAALVVPTLALAEAIAREWDAQEEVLDPGTMPVTRGANAAVDKVSVQRAEVIAMLAEYGDSDLLCYRAAGPEGLIAQQAAAWDPLLDWAAETLNARLFVGEGVMHVAQKPEALERLRAELDKLSAFEIAAAHDLVSLSGSLVLALAVMKEAITPEKAWDVSRVDEHWQIAQWGEDEEAAAAELIKRAAFLDAARFYDMSRQP
ncbi:ATP12 family protein [Yoonia sp. BS5-3]|uniref:ATP12 family chaperone protein n=1 Tax=Yoonia phaeophyticola TaxID=3137369 RepID=A0ABZ2V6T6_9RHOB